MLNPVRRLKELKSQSGLPPWVLIGAVAVLLPLFAFMTVQSVNREKEFATRLMLEKGAALIRSFEAGTRTGMMGIHRGSFQLQHLLTETSRQADIAHLIVTDAAGRVIAHSALDQVGASYGRDLDLRKASASPNAAWRRVAGVQGEPVFEVYRRFEPSGPPRGMGMMRGPGAGMRRPAPNPPEGPDPPGEAPRIIFVGLDMTAVEEARRADVAHAVVMGAILLLAGFAGITLLMLTQSYRAARSRLSRVQERLATAGRLAAGVAHEVRNPLSSIKGFATYFRERYRDVPSDAETAAILIQEVERLDRVVGQLLEFSRPVGIDPRPARLPELIANSLRLAEGPVRSKAIDVRTEYRTRRAEIRVDSDRLNQVLLNLYLNAVEAMEPGGRLQVAVEDAGREPGIRIRVSDTGCGIAPENLGQVFEPYFTTKPTGTGLGLAIAHNIVEAMGGRITVESRIGAGTTFEVNLPP